MTPIACLPVALALALAAPALAQTGQGHHAGHGSHGAAAAAPDDTPSTKGLKAAHETMMRDMEKPFTGDPDVDFRVHMIPHHQGAIDMSRVALAHAKDPETRKLAEQIIADQEREIAEMRSWLARRGR